MRGEIVGGISNAQVPEGLDQGSSLRFLALYARSLTRAMPTLGGVRVLRQWSGCYDITPDGNPLVGNVDEVEGLVLASGFMGHGFMMAPIVGELLARHLLFGEEKELFERWNLRRYREGKLLSETMILG
jgi:sarcosine oxidase subunit beta